MLLTIAAVMGVAPCLAVAAVASIEPPLHGPAPYSLLVTECDRQAAHPEDPDKVAPGRERPDLDLEAAIAACRADLQKDPANPRLLYQLARVLTYSGRIEEALPPLEQAVRLRYRQAIFVAGYIYLDGTLKAPKDPCRAGELIRESALRGRMAGEIGFPAWVLEGRFKACAVKQDRAEMIGFLESARARKPGYYPGLLIDTLLRELNTP